MIEIMNDSPRLRSFDGTQWEIRALKPGTQWLIAQEAIAIDKAESSNMGDVIKQFANGRDGEFSDEYRQTYDTLMWDTAHENWLNLLIEMVNLLDVEVFFSTTSSIQILRQRLLSRKMTMEEQKQLLLAQNGDK